MPEIRGRILRTQFWLSSEIQGRFIIFYIVATAIISVLMVCVIFAFVWPTMANYTILLPSVNPVEWFRSSLVHAIIAAGVVFIICGTFGAALLVFQGHRIAGPVYRINKLLDSEDETTQKLRSGDALQDLYAKACLVIARKARLKRLYEELYAISDILCSDVVAKGVRDIYELQSFQKFRDTIEKERAETPDQ